MANFSHSTQRYQREPGWWLVLVMVALLMAGPLILPPALLVWAQEILYPGLDDADPEVRAQTVQDIRKAQDKAAVPELLAHIEDADGRTGLYIAQAIAELATQKQLTPLLLLAGRGNMDGRWRAAYVLGLRKDTRAIPSLVRALRDREVLVSRTAAEALASIGSTAAIRALIGSLQSPRASEVHAAKGGLLMLGDAAVPALAAGLESGQREVEYNASMVLAAINTPAARTALQPKIQ